MDNLIISKIDQHSIYEIYRACRLCGAGAGYKMPIIQNVVDLDTSGVELTQKIRDCVQIEVHADDKMPPLICELCVDKVNDFYEFMEMCQQTNTRTRARLGLPPQSSGKVRNAQYDSGDCILGVTEKVYGNEESDEALSGTSGRRTKGELKVKIKVEKPDDTYESRNSRDSRSRQNSSSKSKSRTENNRNSTNRDTKSKVENSRLSKCKVENSRDTKSKVENTRHGKSKVVNTRDCRTVRSRIESRESSESRSPLASPRVTRLRRPSTPPRVTRHGKAGDDTLSSLKQPSKKPTSKPSSQPPKPILKKDVKTEQVNKAKRSREPVKSEVPQKKVKLSAPAQAPAAAVRACAVCGREHASPQSLSNHMRAHVVNYTPAKLACDPCGEWFASPEEAGAHHRWHAAGRAYRCRRCPASFKQQHGYHSHIANNECTPWPEVPDVKCMSCWRMFPTRNLLHDHRCAGPDARPGGKCLKCKRVYTLLKNLTKHEETCTAKGKSELGPGVWASCRAARVRLRRCDALLPRAGAARLDKEFGLVPGCIYPYLNRRELRAGTDLMVDIQLPTLEPAFAHWDSDDDGASVDSLTALSLKTIFSPKMLGKVPRKRRKVKMENFGFDSLLNTTDFDDDMKQDIDNIIDNLDNDDEDKDSAKDTVKNECKDTDSVNSESLLCNDGNGDEFGKINKNGTDNDEGSQSLLIGGDHSDNVEHNSGNRVSNSFNTLSVDKDNSTDCETEMDECKESISESKESRVSSGDKEVNDKLDCVSSNEVNDNNVDCNDKSKDVINDDDDSNNRVEEESGGIRTEDGQIDTYFGAVREENNDENSRDLMDAIDRQIGEDSESVAQSSSERLDNELIENHNEENSNVKDDIKDATDDESEKTTQIAENNKDILSEHNDSKEKFNDDLNNQDTNGDVCNDGKNELIAENNESASDGHKSRDENEAMCNDIENKINDLIALRNHKENGEWDNTNHVNSSKSNDEITENNDIDKNVSVNNDNVVNAKGDCNNENNDRVLNAENNDNLTQNDDTEKDKITLEDLLPPKEADAKSMGLDSISDDDFDFDA